MQLDGKQTPMSNVRLNRMNQDIFLTISCFNKYSPSNCLIKRQVISVIIAPKCAKWQQGFQKFPEVIPWTFGKEGGKERKEMEQRNGH